MEMKHGFPPIYDENSTVLILGSAPSDKSLEGKFYYDHKNNKFWDLLADIACTDKPMTIEDKIRFLHEYHFALWDVYKDFEREGSEDKNFKTTVTNSADEVISIIENSKIKKICINGGEAYKTFIKAFLPEIEAHFGKDKIEIRRLISSSGLAAKAYKDKLDAWRNAVLEEEKMSKQIWKPGNMIYPLPAVLVTVTDGEGNDNVLTIAWCGTVCTNPAMAYISVRPERYSYDMIMKTKQFVINLTTEELVKATDYCGVVSGRDVNKFEKMKLTKARAKEVMAPLIEECPVNIECSVREYREYGSHTMFIADVLCVHADEKYMDGNDKFDLEKARLLAYSHGVYYGLSDNLGKFGYSIQKKKK